MKFKQFIEKLKLVKKSTWIYVISMVGFFVIGIGLLFLGIVLSGQNIGAWFAKHYPWFIVGILIAILVATTITYYKYRNGK